MIEEIKKGEGEMIQLFFKNIFCAQKIKVERVRPRKKKKVKFLSEGKKYKQNHDESYAGSDIGRTVGLIASI